MSAIKHRPTKKQSRRRFSERLGEWMYKREAPLRNGNGSKYDPNTEDVKHDPPLA
jgi:hypothetical protein